MKPIVVLIAVVVLLGGSLSFAAEKAKVPEEVVNLLAYCVGQWKVEGKEGEAPLKGTAVYWMPSGKHCIMGTTTIESQGERVHFRFVSGWDSSTGGATEQGVVSDGGIYTLKWHKVSPTMAEGELTGTLDGKKMSEKDRLERKGENEFVVTSTERKIGNESLPDRTFIYHRLPRDKAKAKPVK